ncbi:MAG: hypothetical protein WDM70_07995 [Nitrosomonadales bacterium]
MFEESREYELPLNVYAYSKFLFDQVVRRAGAGVTRRRRSSACATSTCMASASSTRDAWLRWRSTCSTNTAP